MERKEWNLCEGWEFCFGQEKERCTVDLPHDWVIGAPYCREKKESAQGFHIRRGTGWYRKKIVLQLSKGHRWFLDFGGIYEKSRVYVNQKEVGGRKYGYSSFRLEITEYVQTGENLIEVRVDSDVLPTDRWYTGAGIYRTVKLLETGPVYLDEYEMQVSVEFPDPDYKKAIINVKTGTDHMVKGRLLHGEEATEDEGQGNLAFEVEEPALWSAEDPQLYRLEVTVLEKGEVSDTVIKRIGLREVSLIPNQGMYINGRRVKLHGVCLHQDTGCQGVAAKKEIWKERLESLKEMGCNAIRAAHHIHSEEFMDLCDELGFYVYEECFDKWTGGHYGSFFEEEWQKDLDTMIKRDRNRPCVVIWGVGNEVENQGQDSMLRLLEMLVKRVKVLDADRPVTYAMNPHFKRESNMDMSTVSDIQKYVDEADDTEIWDVAEKIERIKKIGALVDILSCNYQEQWYEQIHEAMPDQLILGTETYQYFKGHSEQFKNYTQENPALTVERYDYVIGGMIWTGIDYLGESMGYPAKGWNGALIRTNGERKAGYYIMQSYWSNTPMIHFSVLDYSLEDEGVKDHWNIPPFVDHWQFPQFTNMVIPYMIATNCDEVEVYINGDRIYVPKPKDCPNRLITGFLPWIPGEVKVIGKNGGEEVCCHRVTTPKDAVLLEFDRKTVSLPAQRNYQALFTVRAKDMEGNPYFRESARVRFRVEGPAEIAGTDNGDAKSHECYLDPFMHMYHGAVSVLIRLTGDPGKITIFADSDGMRTAVMTVLVK